MSGYVRHLFIVRVWLEAGDASHAAQWRGSVEHVPAGPHLYFTSLEDLVDFIALRRGGTATPAPLPLGDDQLPTSDQLYKERNTTVKTNRLLASAITLLALALLLSQSAGAGAQTSPSQYPTQAAKPGVASGFSAKLNRPNDQAPYKITFQARLTNPGGQPITSPTNFTFRLYTVPSGGTAIFTEGPVSITPNAQGLLTYQVGSATPIDPSIVAQFAGTLYLGVQVGSDPEMTPRLLLTASPYAMSLAPGATINGALNQRDQAYYGVLNGINTDVSDSSNAGLYGKGATGIYGSSSSDGSQDSYGGYFDNNNSPAGVNRYGVYGHARSGWGLYGQSDNANNIQQSAGVVGQSGATNGAGGVFTGTIGVNGSSSSSGNRSGYGGLFYNNGGGSGYQEGVHAEVHSSGSNLASSAGRFLNFGGGSGPQYGVYADSYSSGGTNGYGGSFVNHGGGSGQQYGVLADSSGYGLFASSNASTAQQQSAGVVGQSTDLNIGVGGVFTGAFGVVGYGQNGGQFYGTSAGVYALGGISNVGVLAHGGNNGGTGIEGRGGTGTSGGDGGAFYGADGTATDGGGYGIYAQGGHGPDPAYNPSYDGYFYAYNISSNYTSVYARGHVSALSFDTHTSYDMVVEYHGSEPLRPGDVLAFDGNNHQVHGEATLGVVKATAQNAQMAMGAAQNRMYWQEHKETTNDGKTLDSSGWHIDGKANTIQPGDTLSVVVMGQVQMKASGVQFGDHVTLAADGSLSRAKAGDYVIGRAVSQPDKGGYVTVFVNLK
ncbi:MAG: hypothetical protein DLM69_00665 [Candidatus Chloroheliales bacterium]|nr:MAG: hypothetical protein DLM69_00665 [Chloroflexota bacterium]